MASDHPQRASRISFSIRPMYRRLRLCLVAVALTVVVIAGCSTQTLESTSQPLPTTDIDATVQIAIQQTAVAEDALESAVAAAVKSTREADTSQAASATLSAAAVPTSAPTPTSTSIPTHTQLPAAPTAVPAPTPLPTAIPVTPTPTTLPTPFPTPVPTATHTAVPIVVPTTVPTVVPTTVPTVVPTTVPAAVPTARIFSLAELVDEVRDSVVQVVTDRGKGSGVIIESDSSGGALILTNQHVIDRASTIEVVHLELTTYLAVLVGVDALRDLAVLRICCDATFAPLEFSNPDDVQLGSSVAALGFPLGVESIRVSQGIISGELFNPESDRQELQTDAAINPGNSGGPLLLLDGTIAGINTYGVRTSSGGVPVEGFGFAIASETLAAVVPSLTAGHQVVAPTPTPHPYLSAGKYTDPDYGFDITPPPGWAIEITTEGVMIWDEHVGTTVLVSVSFEGDEYYHTSLFRDDWTVMQGEGWSDFLIEKEQVIYRTESGGETIIAGHEFDTKFTYDEAQIEAFTHWFIVAGWLYQVDLQTPAEIWQLPEYSDLRFEQQMAFISFHPPKS